MILLLEFLELERARADGVRCEIFAAVRDDRLSHVREEAGVRRRERDLHGLVVRHTFYHFQLPLAIKAFHTGLVSHRPDAFVGIVHLGVSHQADYAQQACRQKLLHLICISISVRSSFFPPQLSPDGYLRTKLLKKHKSYKI